MGPPVPVAATGEAPGDAAVSPAGLGLLPVVVLPPPQAAKLRAMAAAEMVAVSLCWLIGLIRKIMGIKF